jgi:hypothetical protein
MAVENYTMNKYIAEQDSLKTHEVSAWFEDAKFGVIVGWGIYSKPAFAPLNSFNKKYCKDM